MTEDNDGRERDALLESLGGLILSFETMTLPGLVGPLRSTDLTIQQLKVLMVIATAGQGVSGRGLAESFGVSLASMSGLVDRLVAQGAVARSLDPQDGRVRNVHVTATGRSMLRSLMAARPEFSPEVLASLRLDDLKALEQGMRAISEQMRGQNGQPAQP